MQHVKEHRSPTRYSLTPEESRSLAETMKSKGRMTDRQVRIQAHRLGCATKAIYSLAERVGIAVDVEKEQKRKPRPNASSARDRAEALFKSPSEMVNGDAEPGLPDVLKALHPEAEAELPKDRLEGEDFSLAVEMLAEEEGRLEAFKRQTREEADQREAEFEIYMAEMAENLEKLEARARAAIQQTKALRIATREDRDRIEELESTVSRLQRENAALEKTTDRAKTIALEDRRHLKESMIRERHLIEALAISERDLMVCRSRP